MMVSPFTTFEVQYSQTIFEANFISKQLFLCKYYFISWLLSTDAIIIHTVNFLNIRTPKTFVVFTLKFELCGSTLE